MFCNRESIFEKSLFTGSTEAIVLFLKCQQYTWVMWSELQKNPSMTCPNSRRYLWSEVPTVSTQGATESGALLREAGGRTCDFSALDVLIRESDSWRFLCFLPQITAKAAIVFVALQYNVTRPATGRSLCRHAIEQIGRYPWTLKSMLISSVWAFFYPKQGTKPGFMCWLFLIYFVHGLEIPSETSLYCFL